MHTLQRWLACMRACMVIRLRTCMPARGGFPRARETAGGKQRKEGKMHVGIERERERERTYTSATICFLSRSLILSKLSSFLARIYHHHHHAHKPNHHQPAPDRHGSTPRQNATRHHHHHHPNIHKQASQQPRSPARKKTKRKNEMRGRTTPSDFRLTLRMMPNDPFPMISSGSYRSRKFAEDDMLFLLLIQSVSVSVSR